jgi:hypothetical protein
MSHDEIFVAIGAVHCVGTGGYFSVASFGLFAGLTGVVLVHVIAVSPTVILVEVMSNIWSTGVVAVAVVTPIAITVDVAAVVAGAT